MGLDITGFSGVTLVKDSDDSDIECRWEWMEDKGIDGVVVFNNEHFLSHSEGLVEGVYEYTSSVDGGRISYSGWSNFREELARLAGYLPMTKEEVPDEWDNYTKDNLMARPHQSRVFNVTEGVLYELINFSDCEGIIKGEFCKKIHSDLLSINPESLNYPYKNLYGSLCKAFKEGSKSGFVIFS